MGRLLLEVLIVLVGAYCGASAIRQGRRIYRSRYHAVIRGSIVDEYTGDEARIIGGCAMAVGVLCILAIATAAWVTWVR